MTEDLASYHLQRSVETLEDACILANLGRWHSCVNRLYYACFYAVSALLIRDSLSSSKHTGIRSFFNKHYVKTDKIPKHFGLLYNTLFEGRQEADYMPFVSFTEEQVRPWISQTEDFIQYITRMITEE